MSKFQWTDEDGESFAELDGLLLIIWEEDGAWWGQVQKEGEVLDTYNLYQNIGEASVATAMWAKGYLAGSRVNSGAYLVSSAGGVASLASSESPLNADSSLSEVKVDSATSLPSTTSPPSPVPIDDATTTTASPSKRKGSRRGAVGS